MWVFCWIHLLFDVQGTTPAPKPKFFQSWFVSINIIKQDLDLNILCRARKKNNAWKNLIILLKMITSLFFGCFRRDVWRLFIPFQPSTHPAANRITKVVVPLLRDAEESPEQWGAILTIGAWQPKIHQKRAKHFCQKRKTEICLADMWHVSWFWVSWMCIVYCLLRSLFCCDRFSSVWHDGAMGETMVSLISQVLSCYGACFGHALRQPIMKELQQALILSGRMRSEVLVDLIPIRTGCWDLQKPSI